MIASITVAAFFAIAISVYAHPRLPSIFLSLLGLCLIGYAFLGRGFAYLPFAPLFIGEILLAVGIIAILLSGCLMRALHSSISWLLVCFMLLGALATLPHVGQYGLDSFRDAVIWGYGIFALLVASFMLRSAWIARTVNSYRRLLPWFLFWSPLAVVVYRLGIDLIPTVPDGAVPLLSPKGGDIGVHLAGILAFMVLGLTRHATASVRKWPSHSEWLWWLLWLAAFLTIANVRAAVLSVFSVVFLILLVRPLSRWGKVLFLSVVLATGFVALDIEIRLTPHRAVSVENFVLTAQSILGDTGEASYDGTRGWRLMWWTEIVNYTVFGEYFWIGKGYGINLASADGYQVYSDESLRSPHNGHLTILARNGVPGALAWLILQGAFATKLILGYFRAHGHGQEWWAKVNLWILCYWLAFMVNGAFDVFLEGPQGGIWFWSVFGFGIAALEMQERGYAERGAQRASGAI